MLKVSNGECIRRLSRRSMRASRNRNLVAVLAIVLTTVLFTSLFTIAASINYSYQQENFRQAGGDGHGTVKDLTWEQAEALRSDPLIRDSWTRLFVGMISDPPFNKSHVEVSYLEPNGAPHYFCKPTEGNLPREGSDEAATDTHILTLLGVEPKVGAKFTLPICIDDNTQHPQVIQRTFTLSGWWEYDSAVVACNVLLPRSAAEELSALSNGEEGTMTGRWNLDVMFQNAMHIGDNLEMVLENHGFQSVDSTQENYLRLGINWGYTGERFRNSMDWETVAAIAALVLLIVFTGYLIIYNVFQISVTNDIRFYGLLKTIGTTGRQLKRVVRRQALLLSLLGIPLGLLVGFAVGNVLTPVIMKTLSYRNTFISFNPWIFIGAAAFSLVTVFLSCARPGRMAARVSPVEAVRYSEGGKVGKRTIRKAQTGASLPTAPAAASDGKGGGAKWMRGKADDAVGRLPDKEDNAALRHLARRTSAWGGGWCCKMAWANLGRSRGKTAVTVLSLTLAVVLMTLTDTLVRGFDMEKYLAGQISADFIVGHANQFVAGSGGFRSDDEALPEQVMADVEAQGGITAGGRVYAQSWSIQQFVTKEWLQKNLERMYQGDLLDAYLESAERQDDGRLAADALIYGMEAFPLSKLTVVEGDTAPLLTPGANAIAATCGVDDYGQLVPDSTWARVGDKMKLRYVSEWGYYDSVTGQELSGEEVDAIFSGASDRSYLQRAKTYQEVEYTVCALVAVPSSLSFRYGILGADSYVLGAEQFRQDSGSSNVMIYAFDTEAEANESMEKFLADYTETVQPVYDYESKATYIAEFEGFRSMFLTLGGALSFIIGLVGVLNFINAVLTGILTRKREFAVLQSVGMTGRQLKTMLVYEGLYYTLLALACSTALSLLLGSLAGNVVSSILSFFTYRLTITPLLAVLPVFLALGALVPLAAYRSIARSTVVERLREAES